MRPLSRTQPTGLYHPAFEHDACGAGFLVDLQGRPSHALVVQGVRILRNLEHRGASGADPATGDGAGMMLQLPHRLFAEECARLGFAVPEPGAYAVGMWFLPQDETRALACRTLIEDLARETGHGVLGWRRVPTDNTTIGATSRACEPAVHQLFLARPEGVADATLFERRLYILRRRIEKAVRELLGDDHLECYAASLSCRTITYKGMLLAAQFPQYYPDLTDPRTETAIALVHQRYSTNTFPSWDLAHPYRYLCHNGEINTLRGNVNWMNARQHLFESPLFGEEMRHLLPIIQEGQSDSACFDNALELLVQSGRTLPHALMMMIPEAWEHHATMPEPRKAFYEYNLSLMEPWDGPALIAFTDGVQVGAMLDRNGLRPARYVVTDDGLVAMASEMGVLRISDAHIVRKGRLEPGRMLLIDTREQRIIADDELKDTICSGRDYGAWLAASVLRVADLPAVDTPDDPAGEELLTAQKAFGYTHEDLHKILRPMAENGEEPIGSMGDDCPAAVLSDQPRLLYDYFKQLFAQVTNPPLDAIREELVTSLRSGLGGEQNLFGDGPDGSRQLVLETPVLRNDELARIRRTSEPGLRAVTLSALVPRDADGAGLKSALDALFARAQEAVERGARVLILSDRGVDAEHLPIPALLACSGLHHHLIRTGHRTSVALIVESGEPREVHHLACLVAFGASAVNPYLALASVADLVRDGYVTDLEAEQAQVHYVKALAKGLLKVMSKMGISTFASYHGAQIMEAVGLNREVIDRYFTGAVSLIEGIGLEGLAREARERHRRGFGRVAAAASTTLPSGGQYQWQRDGETHLMSPEAIAYLQLAARENDPGAYGQFARLVNDQARRLSTIRGLLEFRAGLRPAVPLDEVEPAALIVQRFKSGAMSFGSISKEAHETLAIAMNRLGGKSNSGEGGEDPERYVPLPNGDSRCSAIKQVASGRFGVTSEYLVSARELQIKMAQGAKPGEGGQLPGHKVYEWIAKVRHSTPGVPLISPPPHHDIYSIEDLAQLIYDLKSANGRARISVKLVSEVGVGTVAAGVSKGHADVVLISGNDGGTGASPISSVKHAGLPWELGLAEAQQTLVLNDLRGRIVVECDGRLRTGRDVAIACLLGAEEFGFATALLVTMGCTLQRKCHLDTCSVGIATQDAELRKRFAGKPEHVMNYLLFVAEELRAIMAELGFRRLEEMVGRCEVLEMREAISHWKAQGLDLSAVLAPPAAPAEHARRCIRGQEHGLEQHYDNRVLLPLCGAAVEAGAPFAGEAEIENTDRTVGAVLGSALTRAHGGAGLPEETIRLTLRGHAGQSFAAFCPRGLGFHVLGDANDYFGKGLSGATLVIQPPPEARFVAEENAIVGNVALYGATSGTAYIRGIAGVRFCVRNSGATAVVEGIGDHGCEYMTGGRVVILGPTGRNFGAGMSGGLAFVHDPDGRFPSRCNRQMVELESVVGTEHGAWLREAIERHVARTGSGPGRRILERWEQAHTEFVLVIPRDYRRVLEARSAQQTPRKEEAGQPAAPAHA